MWTVEKDEGDRDWWLRQFSFTPQNTMSSSRRRTVYRRYSDLCYAQTRAILQKQQNSKTPHYQSANRGWEKQAHPFRESGGELVSKYLLAQTEPAAWGTGHLSGNALESLVWRKGSRVGRRHTQTTAKTQTQHTFQCNDNGLLLRLKEQNTTDCTYIWFWCNVDHPKTYKIPADWSEALQNK